MRRNCRMEVLELDLAFNVDFLKGGTLGNFENLTDFAAEQAYATVLFIKDALATVVKDKLCAFGIRFKPKFFGDES